MRINKYLVIIAVAMCSCSNQGITEEITERGSDSIKKSTQQSIGRNWRRYYSRYMKPEVKKELIREMSINPKYVTKFQELTLQEALDKAAAEGKKVFINCHTENCGPCRMMEKNIFPRKECGDYFNANFVCISMDLEKGEGVSIRDKYGIQIYPTYLILNPDGTDICQVMGAVNDAKKFINKIQEAIIAKENSKE